MILREETPAQVTIARLHSFYNQNSTYRNEVIKYAIK